MSDITPNPDDSTERSTLDMTRRTFLATSSIALLPGLSECGSAAPTSVTPSMSPGDIPLEEYIENPELIEENQESGHVPTVPYPSVRSALAHDRANKSPLQRWQQSPYFESLNGNWNFHWALNPANAPSELDTVGSWDTTTVPSVWQADGFGHSMYRNITLDLSPYDPPSVPSDINPVGTYQRTFTVPDRWMDDRRTFLRFDGVKSAYFVWINGDYVGFDKGSMTAAEFDVTAALQSGENEIGVQVFRWSDGSYLENQDMWHFAGIFRDVSLYSTPNAHLRDYFLRPSLDDNYENGTLHVDAEVANYADSAGTYKLRTHLFDPNYRRVKTTSTTIDVPAGDSVGVSFSIDVASPSKWSAEHPNLYRVGFELRQLRSRSSTEAQLAKFGFREYEILDGQIHVNGEPVDFKGVNHHEHHPELGRTMTEEMRREELERLKQFNINALRNSHYPRGPEFYEFADELGFYVCDEVNVETHQNPELVNDYPAFHAQFMDRFARMVQQWKNQASIFMWSTGNEAGLGPAHFDMAEYVEGTDLDSDGDAGKGVDPTRFLYHQANNGGVAPYADVIGPRYISPSDLVDIADDEDEQRPAVMGEYNHAMGNSLGLVERFWEEIEEHDQLQGGFIWDWVNQRLDEKHTTTPDATEYGNDGVFHGKPTVIDARGGSAVELSGLDDWVELYRDPSLDVTESGLTLEIEVQPRQPWTGSDAFLTKGDTQYGLKMSDESTLQFFVYDPDEEWITAESTVPDGWYGNWHHVAGVHTGSELRLYVDGTQLASTPHDGSINHNPRPVNIGRNADKHRANWEGWLSNARYRRAAIHDRGLSANELGSSDPGSSAVLWLDFETFETDGTFRSYGVDPFCCNGLVDADRVPRPELWQLKKAHQPVRLRGADLAAGLVEVTNRYNFTNLSALETQWQLRAGGDTLQQGSLDIELEPNDTTTVEIPFDQPELEPGADYWLVVSFHLAENTWYADAGHEIAFEQFELPFDVPTPALEQISEMPDISVNN
ncbi:glycoside hydrolase family 2 TIM barrel-domain containing protein [Halocatena marina]|uniref:glycoside hydrolase family 2 TIM barrel-domain containing protein n=1 Tax=Halocatena marina TaxID=2934937 RepID=UPI0022242DB6|nr:glycoside hydrolase family 2 TIM barrel-domain containing protein [Halocatena marina]